MIMIMLAMPMMIDDDDDDQTWIFESKFTHFIYLKCTVMTRFSTCGAFTFGSSRESAYSGRGTYFFFPTDLNVKSDIITKQEKLTGTVIVTMWVNAEKVMRHQTI